MGKFIRVRKSSGSSVLLKLESIYCVQGDSGDPCSWIHVKGADDRETMIETVHTIDEIQAALDGEIELVPREPVQQPKRDDGEFRI